MNRDFSPGWQSFLTRQCQFWFYQNVPNMQNHNFWMDNNWNIPQNCLPNQPPPWQNQYHPGQERPFDGNFGNSIRGSHYQRPYRGYSYRGSERSFPKRTGNFRNPSSSSCLISVMQSKKKSKNWKQESGGSKVIKEDDKGNILTSEKEAIPSKVTLRDNRASEESSNLTVPVPSPEASAEEKMPPEATYVLPDTKKENIVLDQQDNLKDCEVTEDQLNHPVPIPSLGAATEEKTSPGTVEGLHNTEKEDSILLEASHSALQSSPACSSMAEQIPFISESNGDGQQERNDETEQTQTPAKQKEIDHPLPVPVLDSSSHSHTLSDIRCVPVLVREKGIRCPLSWDAPEDYQEPSWSLNQADKFNEDHEYYGGSISLSMSPNEEYNIGRLVEYKSCSPSSKSKDSSRNQTSGDLCYKSPRSSSRKESSSRSSHKREQSIERRERSSTSTYSREHHSTSPHRQKKSPQKPKHTSKTPLRWKKKSGRGCCCHCQHWSRTCQESFQQRQSPPPYLTCKIKCLNLSKEVSEIYRGPQKCSPEYLAGKLTEKRQSVRLKITEKKKKATSGKGRKESPTSREKASSSCHPSAKVKTSSSVPIRTFKDYTEAVLEKKEEIEQSYLQVLLNFGVIAFMLVEKEPCMIQAVHSALRANLRKIGNYYECLLKNYIDSLSEAA